MLARHSTRNELHPGATEQDFRRSGHGPTGPCEVLT
jgi:hypothetical protein